MCLIIDAFKQNYYPLVSDLQKTLHYELRNEELPVIKARLKYLVDNVNEQDLAKINPECPFEAYWFRNRGNGQGSRKEYI